MSPATDRDREQLAARRAIARRLHPDLGGDPAAYLEAMAELDERITPPTLFVQRGRWPRARSKIRGARRRWVSRRRSSRYFEI